MTFIKKTFILAICFSMIFSLTGCSKVINTELKEVSVIVDTIYYTEPSTTYIYTSENTSTISKDATYKIIVDYNGTKYTVYGEDAYYLCIDNIGKTVQAQLEKITYENGYEKCQIEEIFGK